MTILTNSDISSSLVRENVLNPSGPTDLVYRAPDLLQWLMARGASGKMTGAYPFTWNAITAANSAAATFSEGEAIGLPGKQTYTRYSLSPTYARAPFAMSGHSRDQTSSGGTYGDLLQIETNKAVVDLYKKVDDILCGTTSNVGIQSAIDANDSYAGSSSSPWVSVETNVGGALTVGVLQDAEEAVVTSPYIGNPTDLLMPRNQITNYLNTVGTGATTSLVRLVAGAPFDAGSMPQGTCTYNGMPVVPIRGLTNTVALMVDMTPGSDGRAGIYLGIARDVLVEKLAKTSDDDNYVASIAFLLKVDRRNAHVKLTGLTA